MSLALTLSGLTLAVMQPPQGSAAAQPPVVKPSDAIVCKYRNNIRSRLRTKVCRTRGEWDAISENAKQAAHEMIDRPVIMIW